MGFPPRLHLGHKLHMALNASPIRGNTQTALHGILFLWMLKLCSERKWEAQKGFWGKNRVGQTELKKDRGFFAAGLSEPFAC